MIFEPGETWTANPHFAEPRLVSIEPIAPNPKDKNMLQVRGLLAADFALFAYFIDSNGVSYESYFATHYKNEITIFVNTDLVEADPDKHTTDHLRHLLKTIGEDELINFGVENLTAHIFRTRCD